MSNNGTAFGALEQTVNNIIPVLLNFMSIVGIIILIVTVVLYGIKYFKNKRSDLILLGYGFSIGATMIFASLLVKLFLNYDFFSSPKKKSQHHLFY